MRKAVIAGLLVALALVAGGLGWRSYRPPRPAGAPASVPVYRSLQDLMNNAERVVEVRVLTDPETIPYDRLIFSANRVQVLREFKGPGDKGELTVLDAGGLYNGKEQGLGGMPLMHENDHYLLFLRPYSGPVTSEEAYVILGVWQGKVKIGRGGDLQYVGPKGEHRSLEADIRQHRLDTIPALSGQE